MNMHTTNLHVHAHKLKRTKTNYVMLKLNILIFHCLSQSNVGVFMQQQKQHSFVFAPFQQKTAIVIATH